MTKNNGESWRQTAWVPASVELVRRALSGDEPAHEDLILRYNQRLWNQLRGATKCWGGIWQSDTWITDVSDAFVALRLGRVEFLKKIPLSSDRRLENFLRVCIVRYAIDRFRSQVEGQSNLERETVATPPRIGTGGRVGAGVDGRWARDQVRKALVQMSAALQGKLHHRIRWEVFVRCTLMPMLGRRDIESTAETIRFVKEKFGVELSSAQVSDCRKKGAVTFHDCLVDVLSQISSNLDQIEDYIQSIIDGLRGGLRLSAEGHATWLPTILQAGAGQTEVGPARPVADLVSGVGDADLAGLVQASRDSSRDAPRDLEESWLQLLSLPALWVLNQMPGEHGDVLFNQWLDVEASVAPSEVKATLGDLLFLDRLGALSLVFLKDLGKVLVGKNPSRWPDDCGYALYCAGYALAVVHGVRLPGELSREKMLMGFHHHVDCPWIQPGLRETFQKALGMLAA